MNWRKMAIAAVGAVIFQVLAVCGGGTPVQAASLWSDTSAVSSLYSDRKAHAVGDVLTIIVSESTSAVRQGQSQNSKSAGSSFDGGSSGLFSFLKPSSFSSSDSFQNKGVLSNSNTVTAKFSVQVTAVRPNGDLEVAGTQVIRQNHDEQRITITGVVRPEDIANDNTVLSTYVANAQIRIDGKGPLFNKQRQGILTQIFDFLF